MSIRTSSPRCFGPAGVGKTVSARRYSYWDTAETLLEEWGPRRDSDAAIYAGLARSRTVFYTPSTTATLRQLDRDLTARTTRVNICIAQHVERNQRPRRPGLPHYVELLVIDEAERLSPRALEHLPSDGNSSGVARSFTCRRCKATCAYAL